MRTPLLHEPTESLRRATFDNDGSKPEEERIQDALNVVEDGDVDVSERGDVEFVFGQMREHNDNKDVVRRCCIAVAIALSRLPKDQRKVRDDILTNGRTKLIVETMEKYASDTLILWACIRAIYHLPLGHSDAPEATAQAIKAVIKAMSRHPSNLEVQSVAVASISRLAKTKENQNMIVAEGGVKVVELARKRFHKNIAMAHTASSVFLHLGSVVYQTNFEKPSLRTYLVLCVLNVAFATLLPGAVERVAGGEFWPSAIILLLGIGLMMCVMTLPCALLLMTSHYELATIPNCRPYVNVVPHAGYRHVKKYDDFDDAYLDKRRIWCGCAPIRESRKPSHEHIYAREESRATFVDAKDANCVVLVRPGKSDVVLYPKFAGQFIQVVRRGLDDWRKNANDAKMVVSENSQCSTDENFSKSSCRLRNVQVFFSPYDAEKKHRTARLNDIG